MDVEVEGRSQLTKKVVAVATERQEAVSKWIGT